MLASFLNGLSTRRPSPSRPSSRSRRPALESLEDKRLLSTTPLMVITGASVVEGHTGDVTQMNFTVKMTSPSSNTVSVDYRTIDRTAFADTDFTSETDRLIFAPGETEKTVTVDIIGNDDPELTQIFYVALSNVSNARVIKAIGVGTIIDDDAVVAPELSINNVSMTRGLSGYKYMTFTVSLNTSVDTPVSVRAATRNVTARAGTDYTAKTETLHFAAGETTKQFTVRINGISAPSPDRIFYVGLSNATGPSVALKVSTGVGILRWGA